MIDAALSIRRGVDLLQQRSDVDSERLGFAGHSYGAMMGIDAVASDRRFKAAVFEVGLAGMSVHLRTAPIPFATDIRKRLGPQLDSALSLIEPLDAIHYVGSFPAIALLFQSAQLDSGVTDAQAQSLFDAASELKTLKWYDTAHDVVDIACDRRQGSIPGDPSAAEANGSDSEGENRRPLAIGRAPVTTGEKCMATFRALYH